MILTEIDDQGDFFTDTRAQLLPFLAKPPVLFGSGIVLVSVGMVVDVVKLGNNIC